MVRAFEKQKKTIKDQGKKQVDALKDLKPIEQEKPIESKSNDESKVKTIFNDLISKRKETMNELYESIDYNNSKFEYVGPTKDVSFNEYKDSKELFNAIKNSQIRLDYAIKRLNGFLNKLGEIKIGKKNQLNKKK